jgi:outer membrane protein assembly factor BamE (lipoprotein component of BamABCDE complex)
MLTISGRFKRVTRGGAFGLCIVALSACSATYRNHGYVPTEEELAEVVVGVDTRDTVAENIGVPGSSGVLNDSGFYYVTSRIRHYGAAKPKVVSRELVAISFDQSGIVKNIERFGLEDGQVIPLERRVTSSGVGDVSFLRQLMGNIGNFNPNAVLDN